MWLANFIDTWMQLQINVAGWLLKGNREWQAETDRIWRQLREAHED